MHGVYLGTVSRLYIQTELGHVHMALHSRTSIAHKIDLILKGFSINATIYPVY